LRALRLAFRAASISKWAGRESDSNQPFDQINYLVIFVHPLDVLLEVVKTRPNLGFVLAIIRCTSIRFCLSKVNAMYTLLVTIEIVRSRKPLATSLAALYIADENLLVLKHVFFVLRLTFQDDVAVWVLARELLLLMTAATVL
jgi:hypothetical protein